MPEPPSVADATRAALLALRLRPAAPADVLATVVDRLGLGVDGLEALLARLELAGLVEHRHGRFPGWRLTDDGRAEGERLLGAEVDARGVRDVVTGAYQRFLSANGVLLRICTDWQLVDADPSSLVVNDHADPAYDRAVLERLAALHAGARPVLARLAGAISRFGSYEPRLDDALARIGAGDHGAFATGDLESYHATWFELHEHLLATLGIDRSTEPLP
jgi:hypothetical protein